MSEEVIKKSSNKEKETVKLFITLTLKTELIRKEDGETKCICSNIIEETEVNKDLIFEEIEIIPELTVSLSSDNRIIISELVNQLKILGYPMTGSLLSIYLNKAQEYVYIGAEPIDQNQVLDLQEVNPENMRIKVVCYIEEKLIKKNEKQLLDKKDNTNKKTKDSKRTKERRIGFIVEKVNAWRKLYNGFYNENGEHTRYSLDVAANMIQISKKSLDDYLLQLRLGRKYGFDFNSNKNNKVGILRAFVKQHRNSK